MALLRLDIADVRNIESASLSPALGLNLLFGENGSGKTSVLESIYLLGRGKSFRSAQAQRVIRFDQACLTVSGRVGQSGNHTVVGVQLGRSEKQIRIGGRSCESSAELIRLLPVVLIQPASVSLLDGPPRLRRQMLDWGMFHVEHDYLDLLRRFSRALDQRNTALRSYARSSDLEIWSGEVARWGTMIAEARAAYVDRIRGHFRDIAVMLLGAGDAELIVRQGWKAGGSYADALASSVSADTRQGYTEAGPHKGDLSILIGGRPARDYLSRGQLKLLTYALLLAQLRRLDDDIPGQACLLADDIASELDLRNQEKLLDLLKSTGIQSFITFSGKAYAPGAAHDAAMFHVEHGRILAQE
ncbi:MAG: DNA replication/repair protein RecF [Methylococcus sp.]|nr:DNA replication/repair protein RecF [Methylococcus sp.]